MTLNIKKSPTRRKLDKMDAVAEEEIASYVAGTIKEKIKDLLEIGRKIEEKYGILAKELGYENTSEFIDVCVTFFLENHEKIKILEEENKQLKLENTSLKLLLSKNIPKLIKAKFYFDLMILSLLSNSNLNLISFWKREIDSYINKLEESYNEQFKPGPGESGKNIGNIGAGESQTSKQYYDDR